MFKAASERQSFQRRVASHSTKGFANGRVEVLPAQAKPHQEIYSGLSEQFEVAKSQLDGLVDELRQVNQQLEKTLPFNEFTLLSERRNALMSSVQWMQSTVAKHRATMVAALEGDFCRVFYRVAEAKLSKELFFEIDEAAIAAMGGRPKAGKLIKR